MQQPGRDLGTAINSLVEQAVSNGLSMARTEIQREVTRLEARQAALDGALLSAPNEQARLEIRSQLADVERQLARLRAEYAKLDGVAEARPVATTKVYSGTAPAPALPSYPPPGFDPTPIVATALGILFVAFPLTLAMVRFIWKRSTNAPAPAMTIEQAQRFDRLEQSVDAIAIEIERISENQRYLTRLLAEPRKPGVGAGT